MASFRASANSNKNKIWVFGFDRKIKSLPAANDAARVELLGGKSAHLMEMCKLGLPVPPGFTISTETCCYFYDNNKSYPKNLVDQVSMALSAVEKATGKKFGDNANPLLVSVRSGARVSMPGMMDTVLNLGLNDRTVFGLVKQSHDERFAYDCYRRFIQMYSNVVLHIDHHEFEQVLDHHKLSANVARDTDLTAPQMKAIVADYKALVKRRAGREFPQDIAEQLWGAIGAVFESWQNARAKTYRKIHHIPEEWGTAVTVQSMVFGNLGDDCATGVCFTRNPSTGENLLYGEYLINAQGEDVVAGIRTPQPIRQEKDHACSHGKSPKNAQPMMTRGLSMQEAMPAIYKELQRVRTLLEKHYGDMQDIEFTIERDQLYLLQTRSGKRTAAAAIRIAAEMVSEKIISKEEAILRIDAQSVDQLLHPRLDPNAQKNVLGKGLPASPGAASGILSFSADEAEDLTHKGKNVILARIETSPEDIHGMHAAKGIVTTRGGMTSHAAVVARGMGRPCVVGASQIKIDYHNGTLTASNQTLRAGDFVTIDGTTGEIIAGSVPMLQPEMTKEFATIMRWVDDTRRLNVRANADTPQDAKIARGFGAEGIGLCRTEHMFFEGTRIAAMREMILSKTKEERQKALAKLLPMQRADFVGIFREMAGLPVTIRLLDPPLHEFLPHGEKEIAEVSAASGVDEDALRDRVHQLKEINPMLGLRGCRLAIVYPEIYAMQVRAIIEAALETKQKSGKPPIAEIMIPLVATEQEFSIIQRLIKTTAEQVFSEKSAKVPYTIGSMIELPRAALRAGDLANAGCEFFSFGTNDLTQTAIGLSRDDSGSFLPEYQRYNIFPRDPFVTIDQIGVGELVEIAVERGRATGKDLKIGICGEHGGDPNSIQFFEKSGLNYISCSPYRIPVARLAAAQATLRNKAKKSAAKKAPKIANGKKVIRLTTAGRKKQKSKSSAKSAKRRAA
ncbi:MAG: pyruvate, phosphate dikinase [Alphaproteobacteria bacterium]|nr:MAG: pyruvate, phosphate dikinase [Alphaproteobacteria bacterium]